MKQSSSATNDKVSASTQCIRKSRAWIKIFERIIQRRAWPGFALPSQSVVKRETIAYPPPVLNKQAFVGVVERTLGLVANRRRNAGALVHGRIEGWLVKT